MCRLEIEYNKNEYETEEDNSFREGIFVYKPDKEQLKAQAERQRIFEYQKSKGGIIDLEEERNKFLIGIKDKKVNNCFAILLRCGKHKDKKFQAPDVNSKDQVGTY